MAKYSTAGVEYHAEVVPEDRLVRLIIPLGKSSWDIRNELSPIEVFQVGSQRVRECMCFALHAIDVRCR